MSAELVAKLFAYRKPVVYKDVTLYMRIPGDQVVDDVRNEALLASRKLRKNLRDSDSDEYLMHIDIVEDISDDDLRIACANLAVRDVMRDFVNTNPKPALPEYGDNPTQEEQEQAAYSRIQRDQDYAVSLQAYIEGWRARYTDSLSKMGTDQLRTLYRRLKVDRVCEELFAMYFEDRLVALSVFADAEHATPAFTMEEFRNLPTEFKKFLKDEFNTLNLSGDDLKK